MNNVTTFSHDGKRYDVDHHAAGVQNQLVLNGRLYRINMWLESNPPQPVLTDSGMTINEYASKMGQNAAEGVPVAELAPDWNQDK